ncbi:alpha/beta-hydrolase [Trametes versicolor FP-101664 SS1]|uniref:alpha/beta-hydrolase n=1 Tax=Trametes versicolor (strain FP-101664) TaxID=717944 RepID=UPI0004622108|nr:alpha/beta-hydrolase [Trametes versicolor FP-101664 SS1]EIW57881.1 alpha/beta-hydrolase [Trametes versicolor FP-101664 SS1]
MPSYLRPEAPSAAEPEELVALVPLLPIDTPSARPPPPPRLQLPLQELVAGYMRTSHIVPAACPRFLPAESALRTTMCDDVPADMDAALTSLAAARRAFDVQKRRAPQHLLSYEQQWNCVDRYVHPRALSSGASRGITLFLVHSGGFSRQIWEPMLKPLLARLSESATDVVDEIWSFEAVQHGDSAVINDHAQRDIVDWHDLTRDILNFLSTYLPADPGAALATVLHPVAPHEFGKSRRRRLVGVGHSFGGTILARAALAQPDLFDSLVLVEPIVFSAAFQDRGPGPGAGMLKFLFTSTLAKQPSFPSAADARAYFSTYPTSARWDPRILEVVMRHGLVADSTDAHEGENGDRPVRLKTRPFDETVVTYGWRAAHEVWAALPALEPRLSLHWIMSGKSAAWTGGRAMTRRTVWRRPANASNVLIPDAGHSILQEKPDELAGEVFAFLFSKYGHLDAMRVHSGLAKLQGLLPWVYTMHKL